LNHGIAYKIFTLRNKNLWLTSSKIYNINMNKCLIILSILCTSILFIHYQHTLWGKYSAMTQANFQLCPAWFRCCTSLRDYILEEFFGLSSTMATVIIQIMGSLLIYWSCEAYLKKLFVLFSNTTIFQSMWSNMMKFGDIGAKCSKKKL